jgi:putative aldouronate transport system permease protein
MFLKSNTFKKKGTNPILYIILITYSLMCIIPLWYVVVTSLSNSETIRAHGYTFFPKVIDFAAYVNVFYNPGTILHAYAMTIFSAFGGAFIGVFVMALLAYPLSRNNFKYRKSFTFFVLFPLMCRVSLVPFYILVTQYLHAGNTFWVHFCSFAVPLIDPFFVIIMLTSFKSLPSSLFEAAKLDGASELHIFFKIALPLSKPVLATVAVFALLNRWNDFYPSLMFINNEDLYTLQYLLQKILLEMDFLKSNFAALPPAIQEQISKFPTETVRMAIAVVAAGPMMFVFPFFQKYFSKGMTVGSTK